MSGIFGSSQWMYASGGFYNGVATQSLRFDDGSSSHLTRTPSASNRKTHVLSMWVKRSNLGINTSLLRVNGSGDTGRTDIWFDTNDKLLVAGSSTYFRITNQVFRDTSSWYHLVFALDTTQTTLSNNFLIYLNGSQITSFATNNNYSLNTDYGINGNVEHQIGEGYGYFDGYMAEVNFVDGLSFFSDTSGTPNTSFNIDSFGELKNGVWIPKKYTGSYGTNGFRLQFNQTGTGTGSSSTIGADTSGNDNHFSSSGIVASDCDMPDSPENGFATICPLSSVAGTISEGNLKYVSTTDTGNTNFGFFSGKFYAEVYVNATSNSFVGVLDISKGLNPNRGGNWANHGAIAYKQNGDQYSLPAGGSSATASYGASYTTGDIIGIAVDIDSDTVTFYKNGVSQGSTTNGVSHISSDGVYGVLIYGTSSTLTVNFGQDGTFAGAITAGGNADGNGIGDFKYSVPSGYLALCTANLPEPTISPNADTQADDHFDIVLRTGTGVEETVSLGFTPDFLWTKTRSNTVNHSIASSSLTYDYSFLQSNTTEPENTSASQYYMTPTPTGYTVGTGDNINQNTYTFVDWLWKAGGTAVSNTDGTITSSVSANTDAGFSIVTYTGTGGTATVGHGLGVKPSMLIVKPRVTVNDWIVYFETLGAGKFITLNNTDAESSNTTMFNNTEPTTTVFSINTPSGTFLNKSGEPYVCYAFNSVEGYSKFGSYTGNGSADGTFVYTGFRPAWVMMKVTSVGTNGWQIRDVERSPFNTSLQLLYANVSIAEISSAGNDFDVLSNGFKLRNSGGDLNASGATYIYMAFAENPFKYANAR